MLPFNVKAYVVAVVLIAYVILMSACSATKAESVPSDFSFIMDVRTSEVGSPNHVHIRIDANGNGNFETYNSGGIIHYDFNDVATYEADQVIVDGTFKLTKGELEPLWDAITENRFFELSANYQMQIGHSYAFIMIQANGEKHIVDNIGMDVPEVRALVEAMNTIMPERIDLDYGEGYVLQK